MNVLILLAEVNNYDVTVRSMPFLAGLAGTCNIPSPVLVGTVRQFIEAKNLAVLSAC